MGEYRLSSMAVHVMWVWKVQWLDITGEVPVIVPAGRYYPGNAGLRYYHKWMLQAV